MSYSSKNFFTLMLSLVLFLGAVTQAQVEDEDTSTVIQPADNGEDVELDEDALEDTVEDVLEPDAQIIVQPLDESDFHVGGGFSFVYIIPLLHAHVSFNDLLAPEVDLRTGLELVPNVFGVSADVLVNAEPRPGSNLNLYGGGGMRLIFGGGGVGTTPTIAALGGVRVDWGDFDFFTEFEVDYIFFSEEESFIFPLAPVIRTGLRFPL